MLAFEEEMKAAGAFVFSGRLSVVRMANGEVVTTDGPFAESKQHLADFYIDDLQGCLERLRPRAGLGPAGRSRRARRRS